MHPLQAHPFSFMVDSCQMAGLPRTDANGILPAARRLRSELRHPWSACEFLSVSGRPEVKIFRTSRFRLIRRFLTYTGLSIGGRCVFSVKERIYGPCVTELFVSSNFVFWLRRTEKSGYSYVKRARSGGRYDREIRRYDQ